MAFNIPNARKRTLSSDTTESSDNENGDISPSKSTERKYARYGFERASENIVEDDDEEDDNFTDEKPGMSGGNYSSLAQKLMENMGYVEGKGLGKYAQGRVDIIESSKQRGRRGLGLQLTGLDADEKADWSIEEEEEEVPVPDWIPSCELLPPNLDEMEEWPTISPRNETIEDETDFCDPQVLEGILDSKKLFDMLGTDEFLKARTRANPHETIRGGIFQNRAAMKMAELDASFDFMFTDPRNHEGQSVLGTNDLLYFADICAGPGGFSEYVLWKKKWHAKGFGLTLKADGANDFKLNDFLAGCPVTFEPYYGVGGYDGDGDIFREDNLIEFRKFVLENTNNLGVHFVMADGGFSVEGQENIQEILSKQLYLCQFLCALSIIRPGGHFVCKLFDTFTHFSVGCMYLLYRAFEDVCIFKPVTSRPANSERYIVCKGRRTDTDAIHDYMFDVNQQINRMKRTKQDVNQIVPASIIKDDENFFEYIYNANNKIGRRQSRALLKLKTFVQNTALLHPNQGDVRKECLKRWKVPDELRAAVNRNNADERYAVLIKNIRIKTDIEILTEAVMKQRLTNILDYKCAIAGGVRMFLLSLGRFHIFKWEPKNVYSGPSWIKIDDPNFELPRDTLIEAELVPEFKGEGRGQRRLQAVHIIDAIYLGGDYIADKPLTYRIQQIELFTKAINKPSRPGLTAVRFKKAYRLNDVYQIFGRMAVHQMKSRGVQKLCYDVIDDKYFVPTGLHFFKCVKGIKLSLFCCINIVSFNSQYRVFHGISRRCCKYFFHYIWPE
ncbi:cap-specific mRNA (nucleoside-2'-O-)-methyltransferase 1-like isoform X2 [Rhopilema esculentum]|uniref:cap-specific mRNA (nucleoside-2'-O-)-methyltransferase 1-like isoform X2 n=1 Tax=Rhopilema esculentum TaxID=499914 RepID=UPI0031DAB42B